jgi:hypothetical protein
LDLAGIMSLRQYISLYDKGGEGIEIYLLFLFIAGFCYIFKMRMIYLYAKDNVLLAVAVYLIIPKAMRGKE